MEKIRGKFLGTTGGGVIGNTGSCGIVIGVYRLNVVFSSTATPSKSASCRGFSRFDLSFLVKKITDNQ